MGRKLSGASDCLPGTTLDPVQIDVSSELIQDAILGDDNRQGNLNSCRISHKGSELTMRRFEDSWHERPYDVS